MTSKVQSKHENADKVFKATLIGFVSIYAIFIILIVVANTSHLSTDSLAEAISSPEIRHSLLLTVLTCTTSAILALFFAIPIGYTLSRYRFKGWNIINTVMDIPIILPPIVVGLSLLILFNTFPTQNSSFEQWLNQRGIGFTFHIPAIILAQFTIATAFAIRSMQTTFDQISTRQEAVALTLGCNRFQAFWKVSLPQAGNGVLSAGLLAWARSLGEFGPILIFAGATRGHTEVLSTSIFLELNIGNLSGAAAISLLLITVAILTIILVRFIGDQQDS